jgi:hypothetical protein
MMKITALLLIGVFLSPVLEGREMDKVKELTKEIQILNLLNGCDLSQQQVLELKEFVQRVEAIEREFNEYLEENAALFEAGLEKSIEILRKGEALPPSLRKEISSRSHEVKEQHREMEDNILEIAGAVEDMLKPHQVQLLKEYVPCLIPPPGEMRIGQSGTPEGLMVHLERIRELPDTVYREKRDIIVERAVERKKVHTSPRDGFDEEEERERIGDLLDRARGMDDIAFALGKEDLAAGLKGQDVRKDQRSDVLLKIRSFLLDPIILKHL